MKAAGFEKKEKNSLRSLNFHISLLRFFIEGKICFESKNFHRERGGNFLKMFLNFLFSKNDPDLN